MPRCWRPLRPLGLKALKFSLRLTDNFLVRKPSPPSTPIRPGPVGFPDGIARLVNLAIQVFEQFAQLVLCRVHADNEVATVRGADRYVVEHPLPVLNLTVQRPGA